MLILSDTKIAILTQVEVRDEKDLVMENQVESITLHEK
jgi:hypothetical protein